MIFSCRKTPHVRNRRGSSLSGPQRLAKRWYATGSILWQRGRHVFPVLISLGLVAWLVWMVSPQRLFEAFVTTHWPWLVVVSLVQAVVLFSWDTFCLWWLFSQPDRRLPFRGVFRLRSDTIIWSAVNLEIGQGIFAWQLAKNLNMPVTATLGRAVLLALFDCGSLLSLALVGSFIKPIPQTQPLRWICIGVLAGLALLTVIVKMLPDSWSAWLTARPWAGWLRWLTWRQASWLAGLRLIMFLLVLVYAGVCLAIAGLPVDPWTVVGTIPFVLMAESLPGTGGLGERDTALMFLYPAAVEQRPVLLTVSLTWALIVNLARIGISLVSWCLPRDRRMVEEQRDAA